MDDRTDDPIEVELLDTETGQRATHGPFFSTYWWSDGNGSCDCNRELEFGNDSHDGAKSGPCLGCKRYLIVAVKPLIDGYTLGDFNRGYPSDLLERYQCG